MKLKINLITFILLFLFAGMKDCNSQTSEWVKSFGGKSQDISAFITIDDIGNVYTTGSFRDTVDFDPGSDNDYLISNGFEDVFIQKLDNEGNFLWAKSFGGESEDLARTVVVNSIGEVYLTGYFSGTVDFDPGEEILNINSHGDDDIFIVKLDSNGNLIWVKSIGGISNDQGTEIILDYEGNIICTGFFSDVVDFNPNDGILNLTSSGFAEMYILKLDSDGNFIWVKSFGSAGSNLEVINSIAIDFDGNIFTAGWFSGSGDFDPGEGINILTSIESFGTGESIDAFIQKLNPEGEFIWAKSFGGDGEDDITSIAIDLNGNLCLTGYFTRTADFDPGDGTSNLTPAGVSNIFIQKLDNDGNYIWAKSIGDYGYDRGYSIAVDEQGNIYTSGRFKGSTDFDPNDGTFIINTSNGHDQGFLQKMDSNGNFLGAMSIEGTSLVYLYSITIDNNGIVYATGRFAGTTEFNLGIESYTHSSYGVQDIFVFKMDGIYTTVENLQPSLAFFAFPNPIEDNIQIICKSPFKNAELILSDIMGKVIFRNSYKEFCNENISFPNQNGLYFLTLRNEVGQNTIKILKK